MTAERDRRWRLLLGEDSAEPSSGVGLSADDQRMDEALAALYGGGGRPGDGSSTEPRTGGLGGSAPRVARWLGDIRTYFPTSVVQVMQRDAIDRLGLRPAAPRTRAARVAGAGRPSRRTLCQPQLGDPGDDQGDRARRWSARWSTRSSSGSPTAPGPPSPERSTAPPAPAGRKLRDIDWNRTIAQEPQALPARAPHRGARAAGRLRPPPAARRTRRRPGDRPVRVDGRLGRVRVDLRRGASPRCARCAPRSWSSTPRSSTSPRSCPTPSTCSSARSSAAAPTSTVRIAYCQGLVTRPTDTLFVLISDLFEGGVRDEMLARVEQLRDAGVVVVVLLALSDEGAPRSTGTGRRPRRARCPRLRLHPGRVPRPAGGRPGARRHPGLGREAGSSTSAG